MARLVESVKNSLLPKNAASYQSIPPVDFAEGDTHSLNEPLAELDDVHKVSVFEYGIFMLLGVAMCVVPDRGSSLAMYRANW